MTLLFPISDKSQETIFPIIIDHIDSGAEIYSDKFSTYVSRRGNSHLENLGYGHYFINHFGIRRSNSKFYTG